jgi:hypothetical protein
MKHLMHSFSSWNLMWDRLLPQAIQTLNLLRTSRLHPHLSAYTHVHGLFDFNHTPMLQLASKFLSMKNHRRVVHGSPMLNMAGT